MLLFWLRQDLIDLSVIQASYYSFVRFLCARVCMVYTCWVW